MFTGSGDGDVILLYTPTNKKLWNSFPVPKRCKSCNFKMMMEWSKKVTEKWRDYIIYNYYNILRGVRHISLCWFSCRSSILVELEFGVLVFWREKNWRTQRKTHMALGQNHTWATLVGGEYSHCCAIPAPHSLHDQMYVHNSTKIITQILMEIVF